MSEDNVEIVRRGIEAFNGQELEMFQKEAKALEAAGLSE
jgi:hypothetical protein